MTIEEMLEEAIAYGTGEKSVLNNFIDMEGDMPRAQTLVLVHQADAAIADGFFTAAKAKRLLG